MKRLGTTTLLILACACGDLRGSRTAEPTRANHTPAPSSVSHGDHSRGSLPAASTSGAQGTGPVPSAVADESNVPTQASAPDGLTVHEWGTFTSVGSSTGVLLEGLHHEEETLPSFVHGRITDGEGLVDPAMAIGGKAMEVRPIAVTQKLETPVLYFYGAATRGVRVRVDFPTGVVSQWYPAATRYGPQLGTVTRPENGFMEWVLDMMPGMSPSEFPTVSPTNIWAPSRRVASVPVAVGAERERFIFYRGLGAFELPLRMTVDASDRITIENRSSDVSPAVFLLRVHPGGGAIVDLGTLAAGAVMSNIESPVGGKERNLDAYIADAQTKIGAALVQTGLFADEARAMVETWSKSYFRSEGLRVLYVVPRAWTDKLLPLSVEPAPKALVRTLVGRVELLAPSEEKALVAQIKEASTRSLSFPEVIPSMGRLAEPKLRRALELMTDPALRDWTQRAIAYAAEMP